MSIEKTALLPVTAEEAFALVTEPDRLRRWLTVAGRIDLRAGGAFRWMLTPTTLASGTVTEIEPGRRLVLDFGWEHEPDVDRQVVTITIEPAQGGTLVRLVHAGLSEDSASDQAHLAGWSHFFERLERAAVTGDAGPDEWAAAPADLTPLTSAGATLAVLQNVLRGIGAEELGQATPCTEFTVGQLESHLLESLASLGGLAGCTLELSTADDLESRIAGPARQALEAWIDRGLEGTVGGSQQLPATVAAGILSIEFLVHAWDFATATGNKLVVSDEVAGYVLGIAEKIITPQLRASAGFDPACPVDETAPALDRLLAYTGRVV